MKNFRIHGSYGSLVVDSETGEVVSILDGLGEYGGEYDDIEKFDIDKWHKKYPRKPLADEDVDILDFSFWLKDGTYCKSVLKDKIYRLLRKRKNNTNY